MKQVIILILAMGIYCSSLYSYSFEMMDSFKFESELLAKQEDTLYVYINQNLAKITEEQIRYINVNSWSGDISKYIFEKKDFISQDTQLADATLYNLKDVVIKKKKDRFNTNNSNLSTFPKKDITELSEREFQIYCLELQLKENKANKKDIQNTLWYIFLTNIGLSVIAALIIANNTKK